MESLAGIELVADFADVVGGYGGCNADHEFFGYRRSLETPRGGVKRRG